MKAQTHYVFSAGAGMFLLSLLGRLSFGSALLIIWLSFAVNFLIDALGHSTGRGGYPSRTRFTHSIFTAPVWGGVIAASSMYVDTRFGVSSMDYGSLVFWTAAGMLFALGHLFLDSLTQAGVYYWKRRFAIAHFSYNNFVLNAGFSILGISLCMLSLLR